MIPITAFLVSGFWFWNDLIKEEELPRQLGLMKQISANQPIIHARCGLINEYLSEDWFSLFRFAVEECRKNGQKCWIYDEKDWPSGNCNRRITRNEKYREHFLQFDSFCVKANEAIDLKKPYVSGMAFFKNGKTECLEPNAKKIAAAEEAELIFAYIDSVFGEGFPPT